MSNLTIREQATLKQFSEQNKPKAKSIDKNAPRYAKDYKANKRILLMAKCGYPV